MKKTILEYCECSKDEHGNLEIVLHMGVTSALEIKKLIDQQLIILKDPYGISECIKDTTVRLEKHKLLLKIRNKLSNVLDSTNRTISQRA